MPDREKVMKGLESHKSGICHALTANGKTYCPYFKNDDSCIVALLDDLTSLLKAQEPRVMTLEEVENALDTVVWVDRPDFENTSWEYALISAYSKKSDYVVLRYPFNDDGYCERSGYKTYGKIWRCWTSRPTDEQRKAVKWE